MWLPVPSFLGISCCNVFDQSHCHLLDMYKHRTGHCKNRSNTKNDEARVEQKVLGWGRSKPLIHISFLSTTSQSEALSWRIVIPTSSYLAVRAAHLGAMISQLERLIKKMLEKSKEKTCKCVPNDGSKLVTETCRFTCRTKFDGLLSSPE